MMNELHNLKLDLLFRIDFNALVDYSCEKHLDKDFIKLNTQEYIDKYKFKKYYSRKHQYVKLSDLSEGLIPYLNYCIDLIENDLFKCCQLEQAIGVFENNELKAFLSTDSGRCYDTKSHFKAVEEILENGKSDLLQINTFYGVVEKDKIRLIYSPLLNNIDINSKSNLVFLLNMNKFKMELENLKQKTEEALNDINIQLKRLAGRNSSNLPIDQVFTME